MSYTAIILLEGEMEIKVCYNLHDKPEINWKTEETAEDSIKNWHSNHQYIHFISKEERDCVYNYVFKKLNISEEDFIIKLKTNKRIKIDCVEIKEYIDGPVKCKRALFKQPK